VVGHDEGMRVLVVEDNEVVARAVAAGLRDQ
jgi:CheY-like chemotaxis protein